VKAVNDSASGVAILYGESVLLVKRCIKCHLTGKPVPFGGYWSIFCGTIEQGETPKECAGRELHEESKIFIDFKNIEFVKSFKNRSSTFYFHAYRCNKILIPELNEEHTEFGWFKIKELKNFNESIDSKIVDCITSL
jgi:ADP-ribose pyrophosphatase YjhB (NUDIX family)